MLFWCLYLDPQPTILSIINDILRYGTELDTSTLHAWRAYVLNLQALVTLIIPISEDGLIYSACGN